MEIPCHGSGPGTEVKNKEGVTTCVHSFSGRVRTSRKSLDSVSIGTDVFKQVATDQFDSERPSSEQRATLGGNETNPAR